MCRSDKRITVCFRGTAISDGYKDLLVDLNACRREPNDFGELGGKSIKVHKGFYNYLFEQKNDNGETKFEHICELLEEVYRYKNDTNGRDYSDYSLYVTGHSLGGALAQLLAFTMAGTTQAQSFLPEGKPIIAVTYASPEV
eukprot:13426654-Ditylum_brightwellii.AAC.1